MKLSWFATAILLSLPVILVFGETESENDILLNKASQHLKLGEYEEAISYYDQILETNPKHVPALYYKAFSLSMLEKYDESIPYYQQVLNIEPKNQIALIRLEDALLRTTDYFYGTLQGVLEISVHDSQGGLVAFLRTTDIKAIKHKITYDLVDEWPVTKEIVRDNKKFEIHQKEFLKVVKADTIYGFHEIPYSDKIYFPLASTWHYQIPVERGDVVSYVYSIFRPIR
jgi:tetratricopeptide (TPR) repeat protein